MVLLLLLYVMCMKNLLLTDSVYENFEFSTTWMLRIQVFGFLHWLIELLIPDSLKEHASILKGYGVIDM